MRVEDLHVEELVEFDVASGRILVAGETKVLLEATAVGILKKELVHARSVSAPAPVLARAYVAHALVVGSSSWRPLRQSTRASPQVVAP